ncbi:MAG: hypothetical protein RCG15_07680 [Candidatus Rickettsia vulgarisii]
MKREQLTQYITKEELPQIIKEASEVATDLALSTEFPGRYPLSYNNPP